jgi:hypothetical protein
MADQPQQQVQLRIDESKMQSTYANTIRTSTTMDEVIFDFGFNLPMQGPQGQPMIVFNVGSRIIMNWAGAKRLSQTLQQAVSAFEARNGEIKLPGNQPPAAQ